MFIYAYCLLQSGPHNSKAGPDADAKASGQRRAPQGMSTDQNSRQSLPGYELKDTRILGDKEYQIAVGPSLRGIGEVKMPVVPVVEKDPPLIVTR